MNRILVIDDDIQVRESVSLSLETAGYTVMAAGTCQEGLQNHENFQASLIIMDVVAMDYFSTISQYSHDYSDWKYSRIWWHHEGPSPHTPADLHLTETLYS